MKSKLLTGLLFALIALALPTAGASTIELVGYSISTNVALTPIAFSLAFLPKVSMPKATHAGIEVEIWQNLIRELLFPDNSFMSRSNDDSSEVIGGKIVHIPQAGAAPGVVKARSSFPASASERTDTELTYNLDPYSTDPFRVRNAEQAELSYQKMQSIMRSAINALRNRIADEMIYKWATGTAANIVRTSGAADAGFNPHSTATGTRKKFVKDQIKAARLLLNKMDVPKDGRVMLLPSDFYDQLMDDSDMIKRDTASEVDYKNGVIARLYGFDIMERSSTLLYDNTGTPVKKAVGAAEAATDNLAAIAWHPDFTTRAVGDVKMFESLNDPLHYGDIYSAEVRAGGRIRNNNDIGVVSIVQEAGA